MNSMWQMWSQKLPQDLCNNIVSKALLLPVHDAVVGFNDSIVNQETRRSKVRWIQRSDSNLGWLVNEMTTLFHLANHNVFGSDIWHLNEIQFTEYSGNDKGCYNWHNDVNWDDGRAVHRKLSMVIQLSDPSDYEGGDFEMQPLYLGSPPADEFKKQGSVLVFPSFVMHRVTPVTKGTRYSLVGWIEGPKWR